jgi:hypothetical protein
MTTRVPGERRARRVTTSAKAKDATIEAARDRERDLLQELIRDHGYMFLEIPREADRHTMKFRGSRATGGWGLTPARMLRVCMPSDSWLARVHDAALKKEAASTRRIAALAKATDASDRASAKKKATASAKKKATATTRKGIARITALHDAWTGDDE